MPRYKGRCLLIDKEAHLESFTFIRGTEEPPMMRREIHGMVDTDLNKERVVDIVPPCPEGCHCRDLRSVAKWKETVKEPRVW